MTGTLKLFKRTQSEIEDGEPTTKAAAASVTTPETAYNAVPYFPESRIFRNIFIMWLFCLLSNLHTIINKNKSFLTWQIIGNTKEMRIFIN